jgi:hypothetical protein
VNLPTPQIILIDAGTADVSSTLVRQRRANGEPIAGLVHPRVERHIAQHGLYGPAPPEARDDGARRDPAAGRLHGQS